MRSRSLAAPAVVLLLAVACGCCGEPETQPPSVDRRTPASRARSPGKVDHGEVDPGGEWFVEVTDQVGVAFRHDDRGSDAFAVPQIMGSGCAVFDANGDGLADLYFVNAFTDPGPRHVNPLYLRRGNGAYGRAPGPADGGYGMGAAVGDVDNDGDLDVFVGNWGPDGLYLNEGGSFRDVTGESGIVGAAWSSSAVFFDFDLDGWLDLWVTHYVDVDPAKVCSGADSRREYCGPSAFNPVADTLWRNRGDGTFEDVSRTAGIVSAAAPGLGVVVRDFDGDGRPDVYVANDGAANQLWLQRAGGRFEDEAVQRGVAFSGQGMAEAGMGVAVGDVNGDGVEDLVVTHLVDETTTLYLAHSRGQFVDVSARSGVGSASRSRTGFGVALADVDLDGDLDALWVNGRVKRGPLVAGADTGDPERDRYAEPNQLLLNDGHGVFTVAPVRAGAFGRAVEVSRGLAVADLDGDGDLDLVVTNSRGPARIYENRAPRGGHWLSVRVTDPTLRRDVFGAQVVVRAGGRQFTRVVGSATSYLVSVVTPLHFGLGPVEVVDSIDVTWPGGETQTFSVSGVDRLVELERRER